MFKLLFLVLMAIPNVAFAAEYFGPAGKDACDFAPATPVIRTALDPLAAEVKTIFEAACTRCHGRGASGGANVMTDIMDRDELLRAGFINVADPPQSRLYLAVTRASNPMPRGAPELSLKQKGAILDWIKGGAPSLVEESPPAGEFVSYISLVACIAQDAEYLDYRREGDAKNYRYLTLENIYNSGSKKDFDTLAVATDLALNLTAFGPTRITNSTAVDKTGIIRRIDLRDYAYESDDFDVTLLGAYPYAIKFKEGHFNRKQIEDIDEHEDDIERFTASPRAFIRADFFVEQALGDLYYNLIFDKGVADNLQQLEKTLDVDINARLANYEALAAAIRASGVANWNRIIHWFDTDYVIRGVKTTGVYARTYDVINQVAQRNLFAFPLGPEGVPFDFHTLKTFVFDAGEQIFTMPNGLQGYYIADAKGNRLIEADTVVAVDRDNSYPFIGSKPHVVKVAISCTNCHGAGMNPVTEQLRAHASKTTGFNNLELDAIELLFPFQNVWDDALVSYNTAYKTSHTQIVADPVSTTPGNVPTWQAVRSYVNFQQVATVAGEVHLTADDFETCLRHAADLAQALGLSDPKLGSVARDEIEASFGTIVKECNLGEQIVFKKKPPVVPPPGKCEFSIKNNDHLQLIIEPKGDSSKRVSIAPGDTRRGKGNIDISYWVGRRVNKMFDFRLGCRDYTYTVSGSDTSARGEFK